MNQNQQGNRNRNGNTLAVFAITERGEKSFWTRVGVAYVNRDGSLNIRLDALPVSGSLHVREDARREEADSAR